MSGRSHTGRGEGATGGGNARKNSGKAAVKVEPVDVGMAESSAPDQNPKEQERDVEIVSNNDASDDPGLSSPIAQSTDGQPTAKEGLPDDSVDSEDEFKPSHRIPFSFDMPSYHGAQPLSSKLKKIAKLVRSERFMKPDGYPKVVELEKAGELNSGSILAGLFVKKAMIKRVPPGIELWKYYMDCRLFTATQWKGLAAGSQAKAEHGSSDDINLPPEVRRMQTVLERNVVPNVPPVPTSLQIFNTAAQPAKTFSKANLGMLPFAGPPNPEPLNLVRLYSAVFKGETDGIARLIASKTNISGRGGARNRSGPCRYSGIIFERDAEWIDKVAGSLESSNLSAHDRELYTQVTRTLERPLWEHNTGGDHLSTPGQNSAESTAQVEEEGEEYDEGEKEDMSPNKKDDHGYDMEL